MLFDTAMIDWVCPNCPTVLRAPVPDVDLGGGGGQFHQCVGLRGLLAPLVPAGTACKVEQIDRDDYVGDELVQCDGEGRPVMAVACTRDDGEDRIVFAPTARVGVAR